MHSAVELHVTLADQVLKLEQQPHALNATRMGVGACVWEGEVRGKGLEILSLLCRLQTPILEAIVPQLFLAAYLAYQPRHRFMGQRVIELGSGPGLAGILLAKLGSRVWISDIKKVLPLIQRNLELNKVAIGRRGAASGTAEALALEWGGPGYRDVVGSLASEPIEWIIAADCVYIDNEGSSPSTKHFIWTCHHLFNSSSTRCLVSFELRSDLIKETFLEEGKKAFRKVSRIQPRDLPKSCRDASHIELYELSGPIQGYKLDEGEE